MVLEVSEVSIHHHLSLLVGLVVKTKCYGDRSIQQRKLLGSREGQRKRPETRKMGGLPMAAFL